MATLNQTAYYSRLMIKYGAIALAVMIVGRFLLGIATNVATVLFPPEPAPPTYGFGPLPPVPFPELNSGELTYSLQTVSGTVPAFGDRMSVFAYELESPNLLALERASGVADRLGFEGEPEQLSQTIYRWTTNEGVPGKLEMDIFEGTFTLSFDWNSVNDFLLNKQLVSEEEATDRVKDFLGSADLLYDDLENGYYQTTYLKASGRTYERTVSLSESDFVQYDLFREPISEEEYEIMTASPNKGVVRAIVSNYPRKAWLVYLEYNYFPIDYDGEETYPIKPSGQAWQELQQGKGYVADLDTGIEAVTVRRVNLGYFDSYSRQDYLLPVYIFRGDNDFVGYVPAIIEIESTATPIPGQ